MSRVVCSERFEPPYGATVSDLRDLLAIAEADATRTRGALSLEQRLDEYRIEARTGLFWHRGAIAQATVIDCSTPD